MGAAGRGDLSLPLSLFCLSPAHPPQSPQAAPGCPPAAGRAGRPWAGRRGPGRARSRGGPRGRAAAEARRPRRPRPRPKAGGGRRRAVAGGPASGAWRTGGRAVRRRWPRVRARATAAPARRAARESPDPQKASRHCRVATCLPGVEPQSRRGAAALRAASRRRRAHVEGSGAFTRSPCACRVDAVGARGLGGAGSWGDAARTGPPQSPRSMLTTARHLPTAALAASARASVSRLGSSAKRGRAMAASAGARRTRGGNRRGRSMPVTRQNGSARVAGAARGARRALRGRPRPGPHPGFLFFQAPRRAT